MSGLTTHHVAHHVLLTNSLTPWFRTRVDIADGVLRLDAPKAALGIVPTGRARASMPVADVAEAHVGWRTHPERFAVAVMLLVGTALLDPPRWLAVAVVALAVWLIVLSRIAVLVIDARDGRSWALPICVLARERARHVAERIAWIQERS